MALKVTICKAELQIFGMVRNYYHDHALTIARHPSETYGRMMVRIAAFALRPEELTMSSSDGSHRCLRITNLRSRASMTPVRCSFAGRLMK